MPTYAYECQNCGHGFEKFQSMTANALRKCPECGERKLQRLIGPGAGIIFKGSGFYETDYRSSSYAADAKKDKDSTAPTADQKKDTKKSESTKTDAKTPKKKAQDD